MKKVLSLRKAHMNNSLSISYSQNPFFCKKAEGVHFIDSHGNKYLDCINNVTHIGHGNAKMARALKMQAGRLMTNSRVLYPELTKATEKLLSFFPPELCRVTWTNSGSESNDLAMQMAKVKTSKNRIYCHEGAYHGTTTQTMDVSPYKWNQNYPNPANTTVLTTPGQYRSPFSNLTPEKRVQKLAENFDKLASEKKDLAGFISEAMLSCGGQIIPDKTYFQEMQKIVKKHGGVYIGDEVQTGFGRLGTDYFGFQYYNVIPDIVTVGKAIGNGFPVSAVITTKEIDDAFHERGIEYFNTFGGNPLACTAASFVMDQITPELMSNAKETGRIITEGLIRLKDKYEFIGDVRGLGFFQGFEIVRSKKSGEPYPHLCKLLQMKCKDKFVLLSVDGVNVSVIKIKPPMIFTQENAQTMLTTIDEVLSEFQGKSLAEIDSIRYEPTAAK